MCALVGLTVLGLVLSWTTVATIACIEVLVAVGEEAKMAGPQGPLCHRLMAAETQPVLGYGRRLDHSRFNDGLGRPWLGIFKCEKERAGFRLYASG
jgi:hypothetical protein